MSMFLLFLCVCVCVCLSVGVCVCVCPCVCVSMCDYMHVLSNGLCASSLADGQDVSMATPGRS